MTNSHHERFIDQLLQETDAHAGLAPVDLERFWADDALAIRNPFGADIPQVPLGWLIWHENIWDDLGMPEDNWRLLHDDPWRVEVTRAYNAKSQTIVGRKFLNDTPRDSARSYPPTKELHDIFDASQAWHAGSWWIPQTISTPDELAGTLDRVEERLQNLRSFVLPANWDDTRSRLLPQGILPSQYVMQRGPVTFASSIFGCENLIYLILDQPELAVRFRDAILHAMLRLRQLFENEAGLTRQTAPRSFAFNDDNCYLLTADMHASFAYPILQGVFDYCSPEPHHYRYQHSDSAMAHLLPVLARLNLSGCNFGPTLTVQEIRSTMPHTAIHGQLDPMVLQRNDRREIVRQVLRDFDQAREKRGLIYQTAGVVNNGTKLTSLRLIMATIQRYARYQ